MADKEGVRRADRRSPSKFRRSLYDKKTVVETMLVGKDGQYNRCFLQPVACALGEGPEPCRTGEMRAVRIHVRPGYLGRQPFCRSLYAAAQHRCRADTQRILRIGLQHILSRLCSDLLAQRFIAREH